MHRIWVLALCAAIVVRGKDLGAEHRDRAIAYDEAGEMSDAVKHFRLAAEHAPEIAAHHVNLATALGDEGFEGRTTAVGERVAALQKALHLDADNEDAQDQRVEMTARGEWRAADAGDDAGDESATHWHDKLLDALPPVPIDVNDLDSTLGDYNKMAISAAQSGDLPTALGHFFRASYFSSFRGDVWANVLMATSDLASKLVGGGDKAPGGVAHALLCEGRAAAAVAKLLKAATSQAAEDKIATLLSTRFGGQARCDGDDRRAQKQKAAVAMAATDTIGAAKMLCTTPDALTVHLTPAARRRGILTAQWMLQYMSISRVCGAVKIASVYDPDFIATLSVAHQDEFAKTEKKLVGHFEGEKIASRGHGRYEIKWPMREPFTDPRLALNLQLLSVVKATLVGHSLELDTFSHVDSLPGSSMQDWHQDVDALGKRLQVGEALHAAPQGVVVVVPLVDMDAANGPTEFLMGSHVNLGIDFWKKRQQSEPDSLPPSLIIPAARGDCVVFGTIARSFSCTAPTPDTPMRCCPHSLCLRPAHPPSRNAQPVQQGEVYRIHELCPVLVSRRGQF